MVKDLNSVPENPVRPTVMEAARRIESPGEHTPASVQSRISDCTIGALYDEAMGLSIGRIEDVTGEAGDVQMNPKLAYGNAALTFQDVSFRLPDSEPILSESSGHFEPGNLVALMGPSGSGKTTLLDILAAKKTSPGKVHMNGRPRDALFARVTSYVAQDDVMFPTVTVKEQVMFHTMLKAQVPQNLSRETLMKATELRLKALGLEDVMNDQIGSEVKRGISGGQRRRVSLACGLATGAQIFFFDEPTSGLSATDAEQCVKYMRLLCKKYNVSMVVSIHQPRHEVAKLFDHLLLLTAKPGRIVYNGPMAAAAEHWCKVSFPVPDLMNPTDYFLDLVTPDCEESQVDTFLDFYNTSVKPEVEQLVREKLDSLRPTAFELLEERRNILSKFGHMPPVRDSIYGVHFRTQLEKVFGRHLRLLVRDEQGLIMDLLAAIAQGLIVGMAYIGIGNYGGVSQAGFFFMLIMTCALSGIKVMPKAIDERLVMKIEVSEGLYSDWAYILSSAVINLVESALCNAIFVLIVFVLSQLEWAIFPTLLLWNTVIFVAMDSLYVFVAAAAKDSTNAQILLAPLLAVAVLFNGFTVSRKSVPPWMEWGLTLSPVANALEEMTHSIQTQTDSGELLMIIDQFGYQTSIAKSSAAIVAWFLVFRIAQVICLKTLHHVQR